MVAFAEACALRARDAALTRAGRRAPRARRARRRARPPPQLARGLRSRSTDLGPRDERAVGYAGDAARHVLGARAEPATAPTHAAVNGFIASHAAAFAEDDVTAVERERAWQADWLARRLGVG